MHYYPFNIGNYRRDAGHLSLVEHGVYRQLIDTYYLNETALPDDMQWLKRVHRIESPEETGALESVLRDFFELRDGRWHHNGCERVLSEYRDRMQKRSLAAKSRWKKHTASTRDNKSPIEGPMQVHIECNAHAMPTKNHEPSTKNHEPGTRKQGAGRAAPDETKPGTCVPDGVDPAVFSDYLKTRKAKRAPITQTALGIIEREAAKIGWTLNEAITECVARGWVGFKAEWVQKDGHVSLSKPARWQDSVQGVKEKGKELGIAWQPGVTFGQYIELLEQSVQKSGQGRSPSTGS